MAHFPSTIARVKAPLASSVLIIFFLSIFLLACTDGLQPKTTKLDLSISMFSGSWDTTSLVRAPRFLAPDVEAIYIEVRSGSETGELLQETTLSVSVAPDMLSSATGNLYAVPVGIPLVFIAETRSLAGLALSRGTAERTLDESAGQTIELYLLPLDADPSLVDITPGTSLVTIPAKQSRVLRFKVFSTAANLKWSMGSFPDLKFQVRDPAGKRKSYDFIGASPYDGVNFPVSAQEYQYLVAYNNAAASSSVSFLLEPTDPLLVAVNASGSAYASIDGLTWTGPHPTGLSNANDVTFSRGIFVAVGQDGTQYGLSTSIDGQTWTKQNLGGSFAQLMRVQANPDGQFLTTAYYGATVELFRSLGGLTWTGPTPSGIAGGVVGPAWAGGNWFIANGNLSTIRKSSDGLTWNSSGASGMYQPNTMLGVNGRLLIGGGAPSNTNKQTVTSSDGGITFGSLVNVASAGYYIQAFAANPITYRILSVGSGPTAQANYSDDYGASWVTSTGTGSNSLRSACYWKNGFLIGDSGGGIYASADGAAFTPSATIGGLEIRGIAYNQAP